MDNVARSVEGDEIYRQVIEASRSTAGDTVADAMTSAAREIAETANVKAICCFSHTGTTALLAARERPRVPIIALTPFEEAARRLSLSWGLHCVVVEVVNRFKMAVLSAARVAREHGFAEGNEQIVVMAGVPFNTPGSTNILRVAVCSEKAIYEGPGDDLPLPPRWRSATAATGPAPRPAGSHGRARPGTTRSGSTGPASPG
jgi:pyruvate kinase